MTWFPRILLTASLLLLLVSALLHRATMTTPSVSAQGQVAQITQEQLTGRITAEEGGAPIANVEVNAFSEIPYSESYPSAVSDSTGTYTLTLVSGVNYKISFDPPQASPYALEFYPHKRTREEAENVVGPTGAPGRLDVTLLPGGTIKGAMTSSWHDRPIVQPMVALYDEQGRWVMDNNESTFVGNAEPAGTYALYNVPEGRYQFYFQANLHNGLQSTALVAVTPGTTVTGTYAHLSYAASVVSIATSPAFPNTIALALDRQPEPLVTLNGGNTWQYLPTAPWVADEELYAYPDRFPEGSIVTALAPRGAPADGTRFIVGTALSPSEPPALAEGIYRSGDVGQSWSNATIQTQVDPSSCDDGRFSTPVVTPAEPKNLYLLYKCIIFGSQRLYVSHDAGVTWQDVTPDDTNTIALQSRARIVVSPIVKDELYLFNGESQWYWSTDSGVNWETKALPVDSFVFDGKNSDYLYGWTPYTIGAERIGMRSRDGGTTWVEWAQQPCPYSYNDDPPLLLASTTQSQRLFLRCDNGTPTEIGLYRTDNGGDSWRRMTHEIGQMLALDYGRPGRLLWAKNDGLWASNNLAESWHRLLPNYLPFDTMPLYLPTVKSDQ